MDLLILLIIIVIVIVLAAWWYGRNRNLLPENEIIDLSTSENALMKDWLQYYQKPSYDWQLSSQEVGARFLRTVLNKEVDSDKVVLDTNVSSFQALETYDLRSLIGIPGQIAILDSPVKHSANGFDLHEMLESDLVEPAKEFITAVLEQRWQLLRENFPHTLIDNGLNSYAHFTEWHVPNVKLAEDNRMNLLCTDLEFNNMLLRAKKTSPLIS
jgi:hypothetical protein